MASGSASNSPGSDSEWRSGARESPRTPDSPNQARRTASPEGNVSLSTSEEDHSLLESSTGSPQHSPRIRRNRDKRSAGQIVSSQITDTVIYQRTVNNQYSSPELTRRPLNERVRSTSPVAQRRPIAENTNQPRQSLFLLIAVLFIIALIICSRGGKVPTEVEDQPLVSSRREKMLEDFQASLSRLQKEFPTQEERFWRVARTAVKAVLKAEYPSQPIILLLVSAKDGAATLAFLAKSLATSIEGVYRNSTNPSPVAPQSFGVESRNDVRENKLRFDNLLKSYFETGKTVAIIPHLDEFPAQVALLFHGYCDHENAPYRDVAFLFTVILKERDSEVVAEGSSGGAKVDDLVEKLLKESWKEDLGVDNVAALWSRIGNNVALVRPELK